MPWISKDRIERIEARLSLVEAAEPNPRMLTEFGRKYSFLKENHLVPHSEVILAILDHLGLELTKTQEAKSVVKLEKKIPDGWVWFRPEDLNAPPEKPIRKKRK